MIDQQEGPVAAGAIKKTIFTKRNNDIRFHLPNSIGHLSVVPESISLEKNPGQDNVKSQCSLFGRNTYAIPSMEGLCMLYLICFDSINL